METLWFRIRLFFARTRVSYDRAKIGSNDYTVELTYKMVGGKMVVIADERIIHERP